MGRQAHLVRLALGKSAYEPLEPDERLGAEASGPASSLAENIEATSQDVVYEQRYDSHGRPVNPRSQAMFRAQIAAQNDALATVGVCAAEKAPSFSEAIAGIRTRKLDRKAVEEAMLENEYGLFLGAASTGVLFMFQFSVVRQLQRFQLFPVLSGVDTGTALRLQKDYFGWRSFLFAGMPLYILASIAHIGRNQLEPYVIRQMLNILGAREDKDRRRRRLKRRIAVNVSNFVSAAFFLLISPVQIFATLQGLHVIPPGTLPTLSKLWPLSVFSIPRFEPDPALSRWKNMADYAQVVFLSPAMLHLLSQSIRDYVSDGFYDWMRVVLPMPRNPDAISLKAAEEDELDTNSIPGLAMMSDEEERNDAEYSLPWRNSQRRQEMEFPSDEEGMAQSPWRLSNTDIDAPQGVQAEERSQILDGEMTQSPVGDPSFLDADPLPPFRPPPTQKRNRLRYKVSKRRVTTLSSHPAETTAVHISTFVSLLAVLEIDKLLYRRAAFSYLNSSSSALTAADVAWFGGELFHLGAGIGLGPSLSGHGWLARLGVNTDPAKSWAVWKQYLNSVGITLAVDFVGNAAICSISSVCALGIGIWRFGWLDL